jgi:hypothetical protein
MSQPCTKPRSRLQSQFAQLVTREELRELLQVSDRTLSRMMARGDVPEPALKSGQTMRWRADQFPGLMAQGG